MRGCVATSDIGLHWSIGLICPEPGVARVAPVRGSKVILVPFDGAAMDGDLAEVVQQEKAAPHGAEAK